MPSLLSLPRTSLISLRRLALEGCQHPVVGYVLDANGADQVIWNWSVNRIDTLPNKDLTRVYPGDDYVLPFGQANVLRNGDGITVVTWGAMIVET